ncbi:MAG TPA: ABC transporter substrate-binding protein [Xanthobacteraceae bacterium]|nr:ABC transporter substrate-binding protein [Xanthobacteraceae bacterium]
MAPIPITFACSDSDRTRALIDGRITIEGCDTTYLVLEPAEMFGRACRYAEFDITELSFSSYMRMVDMGGSYYIGVPAFLSRAFRHSSIYIRTDRGIHSPADLKGRLVGVPEYQMTAALWLRGMFQDDYGVSPADIRWRTGGQEQPGREERMPVAIPDLDLAPIPPTRTLSDMLAAGDIDAMLSARTPSVYLRRAPYIDRLFPNYKEIEQAYFRRTKYFPIMHLVAVRTSLVERYPWLPASVFKALLAAKAIGLERLTNLAQLAVALPWMEAEAVETQALMGKDYWRYGVAECRHEIEVMTRYAYEQKLTQRRLGVEELFAPSTITMSKI